MQPSSVPPDMYGQKDQFISQIIDRMSRVGTKIPLFMKGKYTVKQPVFSQMLYQVS